MKNDDFLSILENFDGAVENLESIIKSVVIDCTSELDDYVAEIDKAMCSDDELTDEQLDNWVINIPLLLYGTISLSEKLVTSEYFARLVEKERVNEATQKADGTVASKKAQAEEATKDEALVTTIYTLANKRINSKIEIAQSLLNSIKKVVTRRLSEYELSNNKYGK